MVYLSTLFLSTFVTVSMITLFKRYASVLHIVDVPNDRKVHEQPIPKIGGLGMTFGVFLPIVIWLPSDNLLKSIIAGAAVIFLFGLWDDIRELGYGMKLLGQFIASILVVTAGDIHIATLGNLLSEGVSLPSIISVPLTLITIIGVTNAVNLSDGLDGLAGGFVFLCFLCLAFVAHTLGVTPVLVMSIAVAGAVFGFLGFNIHPASIFMGDLGSQLLGFLAITLSIFISQYVPPVTAEVPPVSPLFPLLLLGFPVLDTLTVMVGRMVRGNSPFKADKTHFHHRLMQMGMSHGEAVFSINLVQAMMVISAFLLRHASDWMILFTYLTFAVSIHSFFFIARTWGCTWNQASSPLNILKRIVTFVREKNIPIKLFFYGLFHGLGLFVMFLFLLPRQKPEYSIYGLVFILNLLFLIRIFKGRYLTLIMKLCFFISAPLVLYSIEFNPEYAMTGILGSVYNSVFILISLLTILTLKFTRRNRSINRRPACFSVLFSCLVLLAIHQFHIQNSAILIWILHTTLLLASFNVVVRETRREKVFFANSVIVMLFLFLFIRTMGLSFL